MLIVTKTLDLPQSIFSVRRSPVSQGFPLGTPQTPAKATHSSLAVVVFSRSSLVPECRKLHAFFHGFYTCGCSITVKQPQRAVSTLDSPWVASSAPGDRSNRRPYHLLTVTKLGQWVFFCCFLFFLFRETQCGLFNFLQQMLTILLSGGRRGVNCGDREVGGGFITDEPQCRRHSWIWSWVGCEV